MMIVGSDSINNNSGSFNTSMRREGPNVYIETYAESGIVANSPAEIRWKGSGYTAGSMNHTASRKAYIGIPRNGAAIASGCVGWVQVRGKVEDAQGAGSLYFSGSIGHGVYWVASSSGIGASGSAYLVDGNHVGFLLQEGNVSTTADIYLTGVWASPVA